jgi:predicted aspartyl protease
MAAVFAATPFFPSTVRADDAASLLAKHKAFVGWQYGDGSIQSLVLEQTYTNADGKVTQHGLEQRIGLAFRRDFRATKDYESDSSIGFTGNIFWSTNSNGFTVPVIGDTAKYYLAYDVLFNEGTSELPATLTGTATVNGKTVDILHVTMNGALPYDVYEDPDTGAFVLAIIDPGGQYESTVKIASYTDIAPGKKYIGAWSFGSSKGKWAYTTITVNPVVSASDLHPPISSATWTFANGQPFPIRVTPTRIFVDAKVNGVPGRFILDTGASNIALFDEFANKAHVKTEERSRVGGLAGTQSAYIRKADTIEIGGNTLSNVIVRTFDDEHRFVDKADNEQPDGLMGFDVFAGAIVELSLSTSTMRITDPAAGPATAPAGAASVTVDLTTLQPRVPVKLDDKLDVLAMLDTGGASLVLISDQVEHHGINLLANRDGWLGGNSAIGGVGEGYTVTVCGPMARVAVGPFIYTGTEACESPGWDLHSGLLGFDFLRHFDYVFDYPHGVLYMKPHND